MNYIYCEKGKNKVLFLHGWGGDKYSFISTYNFLLGYGFTCLSVDLSGFGDNPPLNHDYTIFDYANDLKNLLIKLDYDNFTVICHSFGARVMSIINQYFTITGVIITGGAGLKPKFSLIKFLKIKLYKIIKRLPFKLNKKLLSSFGSDDFKNLPENMRRTFVSIVNTDLKSKFAIIVCPCLIIWGKKDNITPVYMAKKLNKIIKNSKLLFFDGGHFCYLENDFLFNNTVLEFLKGEICQDSI